MMKTVLNKNKSLKHATKSFAFIGLILFSQSSFAGKPLPVNKKELRYSILVNKAQNSRKHKVRLFVRAEDNTVLFTVNGTDGQVYQLFIYDLDADLVQQTRVHNHEISALNNILKGNYLFDVLMNDEKIESGQLTVR